MAAAPTYVWHSDARSVFHVLGFTCDMAKDTKAFLNHLTLYSYGDVAARTDLPKTMWIAPDAAPSSKRLKRLPETFVADEYFIVSQKTADLFARFDLGTSALFFSDALYQALMDADVLGNAETIRCRVI